jgi:RNA polymerase subunit RPABC4/transcription elongation factor Spt4
MICPNCHAPIKDGKKFCGECGTALAGGAAVSVPVGSPSPSCQKCGSEVSSGKKFCGVCGTPLRGQQAETPLPSPKTGGWTPSQGETPRTPVASRPRFSTPTNLPASSPTQWGTPGETIGAGVSTSPITLPSGKVLVLSCVS